GEREPGLARSPRAGFGGGERGAGAVAPGGGAGRRRRGGARVAHRAAGGRSFESGRRG
ncbi:hypothetical protein APUTEX25_003775, partial [Auxenochlorella protothecoides]